MIDYETALALTDVAKRPLKDDDIYNRMMADIYAEIESSAKSGKFFYECRYMIGMRGINELKSKGFKVTYDNWTCTCKIKWYPRGENK